MVCRWGRWRSPLLAMAAAPMRLQPWCRFAIAWARRPADGRGPVAGRVDADTVRVRTMRRGDPGSLLSVASDAPLLDAGPLGCALPPRVGVRRTRAISEACNMVKASVAVGVGQRVWACGHGATQRGYDGRRFLGNAGPRVAAGSTTARRPTWLGNGVSRCRLVSASLAQRSVAAVRVVRASLALRTPERVAEWPGGGRHNVMACWPGAELWR